MASLSAQTGSIGRLYSVLSGQPSAVLLLGAGASLRSGIPLAGGVVEKAARWAYARDHGRSEDDPRLQRSDWLPWLRKLPWYDSTKHFADNYPYAVEQLLQPRQARAEFFRKLVNPGIDPSSGYEKLAEFLHVGPIRTILTTNFDTILPQVRVIKRRPHVIDVIQTNADYTKFSTIPQHPQLVYLHGSVDHYTDKNLVQEVQRLDETIVPMLVPLLRDHPLVVVGYRGAEPSVMRHLLMDNANKANNFRHGIFWCRLKAEEETSPLVDELAALIGSNFTIVDIDGFDELFSRDLWNLHLDSQKQTSSGPPPQDAYQPAASPTFEMAAVEEAKTDEFDWAILRARIAQYCQALQISTPQQIDRAWLTEQIIQLNLALRQPDGTVRATRAGELLFGLRPQERISSAAVLIRAKGPPEWRENFDSRKDERVFVDTSKSDTFERTVVGNLWMQCDSIIEILGAVNRPFRLKGEQSENVLPYAPLALKEVVVNALVHRDYSVDEPITVEIGPGSVRIINPGGLVDEVQRRLESHSLEDEIRRGRRGIKGYRNPVLADLFYGSGEMDKAGSGLSDVFRLVRDSGGDVRFGPSDDNASFNVEIFARPESVDEATGTATPIVATTTRYAANLLEVLELPHRLFHAETQVTSVWDIWRERPNEWLPPFLLLNHRLYSFHDLEHPANPLRIFLDGDEPEKLSTGEFAAGEDGSRNLVWLLNLCLERHLYRRGLIVDKKRKRAYFPRTEVVGPHSVTYQARLRRAKRTVVKVRSSPRTGAVSYWEHESLGYRFERFGAAWALLLEPGYVFTFDGMKKLLASDRVNKLSTRRAARDYNSAVHNDLSFWTWVITGGEAGGNFLLDIGPSLTSETSHNTIPALATPRIRLSSRLPTVAVTDAMLVVGDPIEEAADSDMAELEEELDKLAEEERGKVSEVADDD